MWPIKILLDQVHGCRTFSGHTLYATVSILKPPKLIRAWETKDHLLKPNSFFCCDIKLNAECHVYVCVCVCTDGLCCCTKSSFQTQVQIIMTTTFVLISNSWVSHLSMVSLSVLRSLMACSNCPLSSTQRPFSLWSISTCTSNSLWSRTHFREGTIYVVQFQAIVLHIDYVRQQ